MPASKGSVPAVRGEILNRLLKILRKGSASEANLCAPQAKPIRFIHFLQLVILRLLFLPQPRLLRVQLQEQELPQAFHLLLR